MKNAATADPLAATPGRANPGEAAPAGAKIRVLCWSEQTEPAEVYPDGINGAIADYLRKNPAFDVRTASIDDAEQGIGNDALASIDVLVWWGHRKHDQVENPRVNWAVRQVRERGIGFIAIHSAHFSKIFKALHGTPCSLGDWREDGKAETLKCVAPSHPIARGLGDFVIPETEVYNEPFLVPPPEKIIFFGSWTTGEQFRSCCTWNVGEGRVVYFRPGHEAYPIFFQAEPLKVVANSVIWCARRS